MYVYNSNQFTNSFDLRSSHTNELVFGSLFAIYFENPRVYNDHYTVV